MIEARQVSKLSGRSLFLVRGRLVLEGVLQGGRRVCGYRRS